MIQEGDSNISLTVMIVTTQIMALDVLLMTTTLCNNLIMASTGFHIFLQ